MRTLPGPKETPLADETRRLVDEAVRKILAEERRRAAEILSTHRAELVALRDLLLEKKVIEREDFPAAKR